MSIGALASNRRTSSVWRCRLGVGAVGAHADWRWQPAWGRDRPLDAMRRSEPPVSWLRT
jgi:hypothetical protein